MIPAAGLFADGGAMGARMASVDWAATPVGPVEAWPQSLRALVRTLLRSRYPMLVAWGPEYTQLYNDAYSELIGVRSADALGGDLRVTLAEAWDLLAPLVDEARSGGAASWVPALQLLLLRSGYREEAYFSVSHAAATDDDGRPAGMLAVCSEVTGSVLAERRQSLLQRLAAAAGARTSAEAAQTAVATLAGHPDLPFAALYVPGADGVLRRAGGGGPDAVLPAEIAVPAEGEGDPWRLREAVAGAPVLVDDVADRAPVPGGPWGDPTRTALVSALRGARSGDADALLAVLVVGLSPARALDDGYRAFLDLLAGQVATALGAATAQEEATARARALAELDRAKTDFFTNVSHEFRTPLTLVLGPLTDLAGSGDLAPEHRERVELALRGSRRLLRLVDDLLDVARLEGGGRTPRVVPTDLAAFTAELAGGFRSAVERAGVRLEVDAPPLPAPVLVDPELWERVVVNLLSNALKFTFVGTIAVRLRADPRGVVLTVADTGVGVAREDQERLFDRFARGRGTRGRTHEGSGIGLSLVAEVARAHGGSVELESEPGRGSTFTVVLPLVPATGGAAAVAAGPGASTAQAVVEAEGWQGEDAGPQQPAAAVGAGAAAVGATVLVADDNADVRSYVTRLLTGQGWRVEAVGDGDAALALARRVLPDLVLTDVMMPGLDGFGLVRALRADPATRSVPIIVLSARAGQDAAVEGLDVGADDYLVKPFSARELVARVRVTLELAGLRSQHARQLAGLADAAGLLQDGGDVVEAVRRVTDRARRLLDALHARTVLDPVLDPALGAGDGPVVVTAGAEPSGTGGELAVEVLDRAGRRLGELVVADHPGRRSTGEDRALLLPLAQIIAVLVQERAEADAAASSAGAGGAEADRSADRAPDHDEAGAAAEEVAAAAVAAAAAVPAHRWPLGHAASYPAEPSAVSRVRRHLRAVMAEAAIDDAVAFPLLVAASEGVTNAIEHAQEPTRPVVDVAIDIDEHDVTITIRDHGRWRPRPSSMDRGHGSALMAAAGQVTVVPGPDGTTVVLRRRLGGRA